MTDQPLADSSLRAAVRAARMQLGMSKRDCCTPASVRQTITEAKAMAIASWAGPHAKRYLEIATELERLADAIAFPWREVAP